MDREKLLSRIKANKNKFARSGGRAYKLKEGRNRLRVLPALNPDDDYHQPVAVHWIKPSDDAKPVAVVGDREYTFGEPTTEITQAIQKALDAAKAQGNEDDFKLYKSWLPKKGVLINALIREGSDASDDPKVVEITPTLFSDMMGTIELYLADEAAIYALDLKEGFDFIIERAGKGLDTTYTLMKAPSSKPVNKAVLDKLIDLKEWVEKEHFKGEDAKALQAISNLSGVSVAALIAAPRGTALLTSKAASLAEASPLDEAVEIVAPKAAPKAAPAAAPAAKVIPVKPKAAPAPEPAFGADLDAEDLDGMLSELDGLAA